jgi:hypothetical protein
MSYRPPAAEVRRALRAWRALLPPGRGRLVSRTVAPVGPASPNRRERAGPGLPLAAWPAAVPGEEFVSPTGRGVARFISDPETGRCAVCRRAFPLRLDGLVISHTSNGDRCPGSGQVPGEDLAVASWEPIIKGLTPHGLRHGLKVWMDEDQIADVLNSERLGHDEPGMRGVYGHVSPAMREDLKAALQARWEESLCHRVALSPVSAVPLLNQLLAGVQPTNSPARRRLVPKGKSGVVGDASGLPAPGRSVGRVH